MKLKKYFFKKVKSTNNIALRLVKNGKSNGVILSDLQSEGRGQRSNKWISIKGNLFMTVFFEISNKLTLKKITQLNLSIIKRIILKITKSYVSVKLPNDILINKKKICGILQETIKKNNIQYLIVGIGLNLISSPKINQYPTTSLYDLTNSKISVNKISKELKIMYKNFLKSQVSFQ